jgi:GNAT superfamily N-acetyltransferase
LPAYPVTHSPAPLGPVNSPPAQRAPAGAIRDREGHDYEVRVRIAAPFISFIVLWRGRIIANASLLVRAGTATLESISVSDGLPMGPHFWRAWVGWPCTATFRGRGIGTQLLQAIIRDMQRRGVQRLEAIRSRETDALSQWFREMGFEMQPHSKRMVKIFHPRDE